MSTSLLHGILPAVVTPIDANEQFAPPAFEALLNRLYSKAVDGIYVCGQTGEGLHLPVEVREAVAEAAVQMSPAGKQVIVHVGSHQTRDAIRLSRHAARIGATAVSSLAPLGVYDRSEVREYYRQLAEATDLPLLVYFHPEANRAVSTVAEILDLCTLPKVAGVKFTDFNLLSIWQLKGQGKIVFNGRDEVLFAGLVTGADGGIGSFYNLVPELFVQIQTLVAGNCWEEAKRVQERLNVLLSVVLKFPVIPAIKALLRSSGINCGSPIRPRRSLTVQEEVRLRTELEQANLWSYLEGDGHFS